MIKIQIANKIFSRIICGTNAIYARSHFSTARDRMYRNYFNDKKILQLIQYCQKRDINTVETSWNDRIWDIFSQVRADNPLLFCGSTRIDATSEIKSHMVKLDHLIKNKSEIVIIHAQIADRPRKTDKINGLKKMIEKIHEAGLIAGISTHQVETVEICEKNNYGVDLYMFPLNSTNFVYPGFTGKESLQSRLDIINGVKKPFIIMKALAAGRIPPSDALPFVMENCKPDDLLSIGFGSEDEVDECLNILDPYCRT